MESNPRTAPDNNPWPVPWTSIRRRGYIHQ